MSYDDGNNYGTTIADSASEKANLVWERAHPARNVAAMYGEGAGGYRPMEAAWSDLRETRLFVSGVDDGIAAADADSLRRVFEAAMRITKAASASNETRADALDRVSRLAAAVGALRKSIESDSRMVPADLSESSVRRSAFSAKELAFADGPATRAAARSIDASVNADLLLAARQVEQFVRKHRDKLAGSMADMDRTATRYSVVKGGADAIAWYGLELAELGRAVDRSAADAAEAVRKLSSAGKAAAEARSAAQEAARRLESSGEDLKSVIEGAERTGVTKEAVANFRRVAIDPIAAEVGRMRIVFDTEIKGPSEWLSETKKP